MTGILQTFCSKPMLVEQIDGLIISEPMRFISLRSIAATRRHSVRRNYENLVVGQAVHADLNTEMRSRNHGA